MVDQMLSLGYDGSDIHKFHKYFGIATAVLLNPMIGAEAQAEEIKQRSEKYLKAKNILDAGNKSVIDAFIDRATMGLDIDTDIISKAPFNDLIEPL